MKISNVAISLPELKDVSGVGERFSADKPEATVNENLKNTADLSTSTIRRHYRMEPEG